MYMYMEINSTPTTSWKAFLIQIMFKIKQKHHQVGHLLMTENIFNCVAIYIHKTSLYFSSIHLEFGLSSIINNTLRQVKLFIVLHC